MNKVISRILHDRLERYMPNLISANQSDFVKGRSISENVLVAHKIIGDIRKRSKVANVVIKLDMAKASDRVDWDFLIAVLNKIDFDKMFTAKIWRLIVNNWYSILINGQTCDFLGRPFVTFFIHSNGRGPF